MLLTGVIAQRKKSYDFSNWRDEFKALEIETVDLIKPEPLLSEKKGCMHNHKGEECPVHGKKECPSTEIEEGKYSSGSVTYVKGTAPVRDPQTGESYPKETYKKKSKKEEIKEAKKCWNRLQESRNSKNCSVKLIIVVSKRTSLIGGQILNFRRVQHGQKSRGKMKKVDSTKKEEKAYERENPGSDLKRPSKKVGNKRRASFCARMKGMKKKLTSKKTANDPDSRINKSLRAWNC